MHPAPSLIVFTTLSGAGFGLMVWLGLGLGPDGPLFGFIASALAFALACAGLAASLFHLGNPQRAWRALSQWRTSWLSREGVLAVAALAVFGLYALAWAAGFGRIWPLGLLASGLALWTVYATSMIYASIRAVPRWSKTPTPLLFLGYALAGGALALAAIAPLFAPGPAAPALAALFALAASAAAALFWTAKAASTHLGADGTTPQTAIGAPRESRIRLFEAPHTSPNYLMKEMVFRVGRKHARTLRRAAFAAAFAIPAAIAALAWAVPALAPLMLLAFPVHLGGVAASRWLFFAEAEHVVAIYYGAAA